MLVQGQRHAEPSLQIKRLDVLVWPLCCITTTCLSRHTCTDMKMLNIQAEVQTAAHACDIDVRGATCMQCNRPAYAAGLTCLLSCYCCSRHCLNIVSRHKCTHAMQHTFDICRRPHSSHLLAQAAVAALQVADLPLQLAHCALQRHAAVLLRLKQVAWRQQRSTRQKNVVQKGQRCC